MDLDEVKSKHLVWIELKSQSKQFRTFNLLPKSQGVLKLQRSRGFRVEGRTVYAGAMDLSGSVCVGDLIYNYRNRDHEYYKGTR